MDSRHNDATQTGAARWTEGNWPPPRWVAALGVLRTEGHLPCSAAVDAGRPSPTANAGLLLEELAVELFDDVEGDADATGEADHRTAARSHVGEDVAHGFGRGGAG